jgi:4-hydroxybenzoate polyprenyltransferase
MKLDDLPGRVNHNDVTTLARLGIFAADIKLSHSVFAMPFALLASFLAAGGLPSAVQIALIVLCMVFARTFAMAMNRLLDASIDARNPRTAGRAIPSGALSRSFVVAAIVVGGLAFIVSASGFGWLEGNWLPAILAPLALAFVGAYPLLKRFTRWAHFYLGAALGLAPVCAWIAIAGELSWVPAVLGLAVTLWTGGFDVLYATQDVEIDRRDGLFSLPARLGVARALWLARAAHVLSVACLAGLGVLSPQLGLIWFVAVGLVACVLLIEHRLVRPDDLSKLNFAFFTLNGMVSLTLGLLGILDVIW